jgi:hypothetical protein
MSGTGAKAIGRAGAAAMGDARALRPARAQPVIAVRKLVPEGEFVAIPGIRDEIGT